MFSEEMRSNCAVTHLGGFGYDWKPKEELKKQIDEAVEKNLGKNRGNILFISVSSKQNNLIEVLNEKGWEHSPWIQSPKRHYSGSKIAFYWKANYTKKELKDMKKENGEDKVEELKKKLKQRICRLK